MGTARSVSSLSGSPLSPERTCTRAQTLRLNAESFVSKYFYRQGTNTYKYKYIYTKYKKKNPPKGGSLQPCTSASGQSLLGPRRARPARLHTHARTQTGVHARATLRRTRMRACTSPTGRQSWVLSWVRGAQGYMDRRFVRALHVGFVERHIVTQQHNISLQFAFKVRSRCTSLQIRSEVRHMVTERYNTTLPTRFFN